MSDQKERYLNSKVFCMLPWVHMHLWPNGDTYPCCLAESRMPVGNSHKNSLQELWNNKNMKNLRNNMLQGRESLECRRCYESSVCINRSSKELQSKYEPYFFKR